MRNFKYRRQPRQNRTDAAERLYDLMYESLKARHRQKMLLLKLGAYLRRSLYNDEGQRLRNPR